MASSPFKISMDWKPKRGGGGGSSSKRKREETPKKHRSSEFSRGSSRGVVSKLDSSDVRNLVTDPDARVVMRSLGERVETFSSQQTVYLESVVEEDVISGLQSKISSLEGLLANVTKSLEGQKDATKSLENRLDESELFLHQGMCNALRSFADLILAAFFKACGKDAAGFEERAAWLANRGADGGEAFVTREAVTFTLFGVEKTVGRREFRLIRGLRRASSDMSSNVCHSATPIEVATALEKQGAYVFANDFKDICALFRLFFDVSTKKMVKDFKDGQLNQKFQKKFKPDRPPQT